MQDSSLIRSSRLLRRVALGSGMFIFFHMTLNYITRFKIVQSVPDNPFISLYHDFMNNLSYLAFFLLVVSIVAHFFLQKKIDEMERVHHVYTISGYVFLANKKPIEGAAIYVDGIDTRSRTDVDGWFRVKVDDHRSWKVKAVYQGKDVQTTVGRNETQKSLTLILPVSVLSKR